MFGGRGNTTQVAGGQIPVSVYYVPGIIALGVIAACFGNLVASVTAQRERGVLKRRRATPVPAAAIIAGRVLVAIVIAVVLALAFVVYRSCAGRRINVEHAREKIEKAKRR